MANEEVDQDEGWQRGKEDEFTDEIQLMADALRTKRQQQRQRRREMELMLLENDGDPVECCPSVVEMVEPWGGMTRDGIFVELFRDGDVKQKFYERTCRPDVIGKQCRFVDKRFQRQSRCIQKYSYTYALVRYRSHGDHHHHHSNATVIQAGQDWRLDYIRVLAGCECELEPIVKKRNSKKPSRDFL